MSEKRVLGCRRCGHALTREVFPLPEMPEPEMRAGGGGYSSTVATGYVATEPHAVTVDDDRPAGSTGCLVVNIEDGLQLLVHEDPVRSSGCCGHDGLDGPNRRCPGCRSEVATLRDDCWSPQELRFEPGVVTLMPLSKTWT